MQNSNQIKPNADPNNSSEHSRSGKRHGVLRSANILNNNEELSSVCVIRDLSKTGARALVDHPANIPDAVILELNRTRIRHNCKVVWRGDFEVGLQFIT